MKFPKQGAYSSLIASFVQHFENRCGRIRVFPSESEWFKFIDVVDGVPRWDLDLVMHLPEWKVRRDVVSIVVRARERIAGPKNLLPIVTNSTVCLSYYEIGNECELLHTVHFDFGPSQPRHPLFHAQLTNEPPNVSERIQQELEIHMPIPRAKLFKFARIPTSDMTLPSALLCLGADHCEDAEAVAAFREALKKARATMQYANAESIANIVSGAVPKSLCSSAWFQA